MLQAKTDKFRLARNLRNNKKTLDSKITQNSFLFNAKWHPEMTIESRNR